LEKKRTDRNRKTKIALTQKQKVHAEKLFQYLGGSVSRKDIEKTAFNAAVIKRSQDNRINNAIANYNAQSAAALNTFNPLM
jgi:hypothetical protein